MLPRIPACVYVYICACVHYFLLFILVLFHSPELKATEKEVEVVLKFPEAEALSPPILQINDVSFGYSSDRMIFSNVNLGATLESRICIVSSAFFFKKKRLLVLIDLYSYFHYIELINQDILY